MRKKLPFLLFLGCVIFNLGLISLQDINKPLEEERSLGLKLSYRALQPGEVILIKFPHSEDINEIRGEIFGRDLNFWKQGKFLYSLVGVTLSTLPVDYFLNVKIDYKSGLKFSKKYKITVLDKQFGIQELTVDPRYIHLTSKDWARVQQERNLLKKVYKNSDKDKLWKGSFIQPIKTEISSPFGLRRIFNNQPRSRHSGVDLRAETGAPIKASNAGRVVLARDLFFAGNCIIIDHGKEIFSIYCHLSRLLAQESELIEKGQIIGLAGATGRVTGPHLHWSIKVGGVNISPYSLLYLELE